MAKPSFLTNVAVRPLPEQTDPAEGRWGFAYTVTIRNDGDQRAQLVARHWVITDGSGTVHEVRGLGVVGHQPLLDPGESFEYTSWTPLATPHGTMRGTFFGMTDDAHAFESPIAEFALADPARLH